MMFGLFRRRPVRVHKADPYFDAKFRERLGRDAYRVVREAYNMRFEYPALSGPELVRLAYWGASGSAS